MRLLDIEGTVCPTTFVHRVLFPYAHERLASFVDEHGAEPEVGRLLDEAAREAGVDRAGVVGALRAWIEADRKVTALKALQGRIWRAGYLDGTLVCPLYPDVAPALARWRAQGEALAVFSSGSVEAQQLLFGHTDAGDLRGLFGAWFDTTTGPKRDPAAYVAIARAVGEAPGAITFYSDVVEELDAAGAAGLATVWVVREGPLPEAPRHRAVRDLAGEHPASTG